MLSRKERIGSPRLITLLLKKGSVWKGRHFFVRFMPSIRPQTEIAIAVGKKVSPKAVLRNRIKRQTSEAFRLSLPHSSASIVALVALRPTSTPPSFSELKQEVMDFLRKAKQAA